MKVLLAQVNQTIGDFTKNYKNILKGINLGREQGADVVLFPELTICGYPPEDLLMLPQFLELTQKTLEKVIQSTKGITIIVGTPRQNPKGEKWLYNSAAVIQNQSLVGFHDKVLLPTYDVFDERRYFEPGHSQELWDIAGKKVAITICEDIWRHSELLNYTYYRHDPILDLRKLSPHLLLNLSASPYSFSKFDKRLKVCSKASATLRCPLLFCNQVGGNDSLIFDGYSIYMNGEGQLLQLAKGFEEDFLLIDLTKEIEPIEYISQEMEDLYRALVVGVRDYFHKLGFAKACLGLSGGIDSALVACIAKDALGADNVLAVCMPSRYTSEESLRDTKLLVQRLGIQYLEVSIESPFESYLQLLAPHFQGKPFDTTEENLQSRIRGMILMAISNKLGHIVLSTGNKSEMAMGYATLYGDMCGGVAVIADVTKMQVYALANWINRNQEIIPLNVIQRPPSAELRHNQTDQDSLPDYTIIDNVLEAYVEDHQAPAEIAKQFGYSLDLVMDLVRRIHLNEYKRRQSPPGFRVTEKSFSVGRRFPIVERLVY